jgi:hypothetical protein
MSTSFVHEYVQPGHFILVVKYIMTAAFHTL